MDHMCNLEKAREKRMTFLYLEVGVLDPPAANKNE